MTWVRLAAAAMIAGVGCGTSEVEAPTPPVNANPAPAPAAPAPAPEAAPKSEGGDATAAIAAFDKATDWAGTPPKKQVALKKQYGADEALEAALAAGVKIADTDPDLTGDWLQGNKMGAGLTMAQLIERRKERPGVYTLHITAYLVNGADAMLQMTTFGYEVTGANMQCQFARETTVSYAGEAQEINLAPMFSDLGPDKLNEDPCTDLISLTVDRIEGGKPGDSFVENRRKK